MVYDQRKKTAPAGAVWRQYGLHETAVYLDIVIDQ